VISREHLTIDGTGHGKARAQQASLLPAISLCLLRNNLRNMQPGNGRVVEEILPGEMAGIIWADGKIGAGPPASTLADSNIKLPTAL
jgi:hypothetical protein